MISLVLLFLLVAPSASSAPVGFSLELTFNHNINLSSIRSADATGSPPAPPPSTIRPGVIVNNHLNDAYARIGFGTPGEQLQVLHIDTGSDLTWFQCDPLREGFRQEFPLFKPSQSRTFRPIRFDDPVCRRRSFQVVGDSCLYKKTYGGGVWWTEGALSMDTLTAPSSDGRGTVRHERFVFGCSHATGGPGFYSGSSGILGLGRGALAMQKQLQQTKFSHCFPVDINARTYLRFGADTTKRGNTNPPRSTPFASNSQRDASPNYYYLSIVDFSVNNKRLNLDRSFFAVGPRRGCVIDSGTTFTKIYSGAYKQVWSILVEHFASLGLRPLVGGDLPYGSDLCYRRADGREIQLPSMDIHFAQGDDYHIPPENLFFFRTSPSPVFCWAMKRSERFTILGRFQQQNMRVIYDLERATDGALLFAPEDCSRDPAA